MEDFFGRAAQAYAFWRDDERAVDEDRMGADRVKQRFVGKRRTSRPRSWYGMLFSRKIWRTARPARASSCVSSKRVGGHLDIR